MEALSLRRSFVGETRQCIFHSHFLQPFSVVRGLTNFVLTSFDFGKTV